MRKVKRIGVGSAIKIGALLGAFIWTIFGFIFMVLPGIALTGCAATTLADMEGMGFAAGWGVGVILLGWIGGILGSIIMGAIYGVILAWAYNVVSGWVGGLEVEVE